MSIKPPKINWITLFESAVVAFIMMFITGAVIAILFFLFHFLGPIALLIIIGFIILTVCLYLATENGC